jgi:hypothetical protein
MICSGAHKIYEDEKNKASRCLNPSYYELLQISFKDYPNPNFNQIELDLHRTFPDSE